MKTIKLLALLTLINFSIFSQATWVIDKAHTNVQFAATHLMVSETTGHFKDFEGKVVTKTNNFENASIDFSINVKSIDTDDAKRDEHLLAADFFDAEKYPTINFKSTSFKKIDEKNYKLTGDMTMHGVTKKITLDVKSNGTVKDPWGGTRAGFKLKGTLKRSDFGMSFNKTMDTGGLIVSDEIELSIPVELVKQ